MVEGEHSEDYEGDNRQYVFYCSDIKENLSDLFVAVLHF